MKALQTIQARISLWGGLCLALTVTVLTVRGAIKGRETATQAAGNQVVSFAKQQAESARSELSGALQVARTLAHTLSGVKNPTDALDLNREAVNGVLQSVLVQNPDYLGVYTAWEVDAFDDMDIGFADTEGHDETGRFIPCWTRAEDGTPVMHALIHYQDEATAGGANLFYTAPRASMKEYLSDPIAHPLFNNRQVVSISVPIVNEDTFYGVAGIYLAVDTIQNMTADAQVSGGPADVLFIAPSGHLVAGTGHADDIGATVAKVAPAAANVSRDLKADGSLVKRDGLMWAASTLQVGEASPWNVLVSIPESRITAAVNASVKEQIFLGIACLLGGQILLWFMARGLSRPLRKTVEILHEVVDGTVDLTRRLDEKAPGEIGALAVSFNTFVDQIHNVVRNVVGGTEEINRGAAEVSSVSQALSDDTTKQAASLQELSGSLVEMSAATENNASSADEASNLAQQSKESADRGRNEMQEMVEAVTEIKDSAGEISKVIKVIDEIAFQTNLLALNAAVEAARAGEAGKGFSVVAEEVRNLARRSADAAKDSARMITASVERAQKGAQIAERVGKSLEEINADANKVNDLLADIATACAEQARGIALINSNVSNLEEGTQDNAHGAVQMASSAEHVAGQVQGLRGLVQNFRIGECVSEVEAEVSHAAATPAATLSAPIAVAKDSIPEGLELGETVIDTDDANARAAADMVDDDSFENF